MRGEETCAGYRVRPSSCRGNTCKRPARSGSEETLCLRSLEAQRGRTEQSQTPGVRAAAPGEEPRRRPGGNEPAIRGQRRNTTGPPGTLTAPPAATPRPPFRSPEAKRVPASYSASLRVPHTSDHPSPPSPPSPAGTGVCPTSSAPTPARRFRLEAGRGNATTCPDPAASRSRREPRAPWRGAGLPKLGTVSVQRHPSLALLRRCGRKKAPPSPRAPPPVGVVWQPQPRLLVDPATGKREAH